MIPLRFCMLTTFYPPYNFGGDGIGIQRLCHGLVRRGHEVTVVHDRDAWRLLSKRDDPAPLKEPEGLRVVGLETRFGLMSELLVQQLGRPVVHKRRIRRILDEVQPDVINFHNVSLVGGPGLFGMGAALKLYMAHEHWLVCPMHVLWRHDRELCTGRECLRCSLSFKRPPQLWRGTGLLREAAQHVDQFIAMSEFSRKKHAEFGFEPEMEVLPYFLPDPPGPDVPGSSSAPSPAESDSPHERPYFLFVGRLEKIKGLEDVIPVFRDYPDADLLIAGDGTHGDVLRALGAGIERVRFLGRVDPEHLRAYYQHALALIVPSVCYETFGIILIESFRQGTPVIARRIGPFPEIVERAAGGRLFSSREDLLDAMRTLQTEPETRARMAAAGYQAYVEHWSENAVVPRYLDLVRRVAERKGQTDLIQKLATTPAESCTIPQ